jgi:hypothetical protein
MMHPSLIEPDAELCEYLQGKVHLGDSSSSPAVTVYRDWGRPTNGLPTDFIVVFVNGDIEGLGSGIDFARGNLMVGLYSKMNDDGSVKINRIQKILQQFDTLIEGLCTDNYYFEYDMPQFITPTTPNQASGYSVTMLNLRWTTNQNFSNPKTIIENGNYN